MSNEHDMDGNPIARKQIDDGGPAFPFTEHSVNNGHYEGRYEIHREYSGMTLRDYFAAMALKGMLSASAGLSGSASQMQKIIDGLPAASYALADAMIAERNKR